MHIPVHLNSKILAVMKIKNSQKKYYQTSLIDKKKKFKKKKKNTSITGTMVRPNNELCSA